MPPFIHLKNLVELALVKQLRMASLARLQLDRHLLPVCDVDPQVYVPEASRPNLPEVKPLVNFNKKWPKRPSSPDKAIFASDHKLAPGRSRCGRHSDRGPGFPTNLQKSDEDPVQVSTTRQRLALAAVSG